MGINSLEQALPAGDRILLDTTTLAAYLDATEATHGVASHVVETLVASGRNPAVVSMITVMELLVRPLRLTPRGHHTILAFLRSQPNMTAVPVDLQVAQDAASLRAAQRFSPPDALIVGTGFATQVGHLVTNDRAWSRKLAGLESRIRVCTLADHLEPTSGEITGRWIREGKLTASKVGIQHVVDERDLELLDLGQTVPAPDWWGETATGEPMPDWVDVIRTQRAEH